MLGPEQVEVVSSQPQPREHGVLGWLGQLFVRRRGILLVSLFAAASLVVRLWARELELEGAAGALAIGVWVLRVWAMGYRNWVCGLGERHFMTCGPYVWLRHLCYAANFVAGLAWFALAGELWLLFAYANIY